MKHARAIDIGREGSLLNAPLVRQGGTSAKFLAKAQQERRLTINWIGRYLPICLLTAFSC
jgi:hypothetical protein